MIITDFKFPYLRSNEEQHEELLTRETQRRLALSRTRRRTTARRAGAVRRGERTDTLRGAATAHGWGDGVVVASTSGVVLLHGLDVVVSLEHVKLKGQLTKAGQSREPVSCSMPLVQVFTDLQKTIV